MSKSASSDTPSIIIIGAGSAGIAAASKLIENGYNNVTILEVENRYGGRIHSVECGDAIIDLGAEECHGEDDNIVYQLAKDYGALDATRRFYKFYSSSGKSVNQMFYYQLSDIVDEIYYEEKKKENVTLGDYIIEKYDKIITDRFKDDKEKLKAAEDFKRCGEKLVITNEGTFNWFSSAAEVDYEETEGNQEILWNGVGYKTILQILMKTYPDPNKTLGVEEKIILNKEVVKIQWRENLINEDKVAIVCSDGSSYVADHVIVTVSLGVLKSSHQSLFEPSLPERKSNMIRDLGIEGVGKVFVHFPERWWSNRYFGATLDWRDEDLSELSESGPGKSNQSWLVDLVSFAEAPKNPKVLMAWFAGNYIPHIESLSDEVIIEGIMYAINKFFKGVYPNIPQPSTIMRYKWYTNPHFRGAYSFQTIKSRARNENGQLVLSEPLAAESGKNVLLFAGEATSPNHYATVTGAIESGIREADRIINFYKK